MDRPAAPPTPSYAALSANVPASLADRVRALAADRGTSVSALVKQLVAVGVAEDLIVQRGGVAVRVGTEEVPLDRDTLANALLGDSTVIVPLAA